MAGLFAGMICLGLVVDQIGRKWASVTTAGIMFVGELPILILTTHMCSAICYICRHSRICMLRSYWETIQCSLVYLSKDLQSAACLPVQAWHDDWPLRASLPEPVLQVQRECC